MGAHVIEAMLLRWSDSHNGRTVTLQLPADGEHPFRGLPCGPVNGQRLALSVALISDDESTKALEAEPVQKLHELKPTPQAPEKPAGGGNGKGGDKHRLSRQAALCCQSAVFRTFLNEQHETTIDEAELAADFVRAFCRVKSRAEFDTDVAAGDRWRDLHDHYIAWMHAP